MEKKEKKDAGETERPAIEYKGWKAMPYVIGNETFEKLGTIGTQSNLLVYLTSVFHMKSVAAATLLNIFNGTTNLATVLGAFISDAYLGRFTTIACATMASLSGLILLTLTAGIPSLHPRHCDPGQQCAQATPWQLAILLCSFAFLVVGGGGIRPCNLAFGADQFDPNTESGKRGIGSFFNWYYFTFTIAVMTSSTVIIYIQSDVSWTLGLGIPAVLMFLSAVVFFLGTRLYVKVRPEGSPFTGIAQVFVAAIKKRGLDRPQDLKESLFDPPHLSTLNSKLSYSDQFRFLDKASIVTTKDEIKANGVAENPWRLCTLQQVEEVKCLLRIIPIWSAGIMFNVAIAQHSNYMVFQALQSDRHLGKSKFQIPAGSFGIFSMLALTLWIPVYDRVIVPRLQRLTGKEGGITLLQRMAIGLILSIVALIISALVEDRRRNSSTIKTALDGNAISSMSSLWLILQLTVFGLSEAFNTIGQIEFYYKQFPENMRSVAGSLFFCSIAISNYLSGFMVAIVHRTTGRRGRANWLAQDLNKGRLDYFYLMIAACGVVNFIYFIACARWYRYKGLNVRPQALELNQVSASPV